VTASKEISGKSNEREPQVEDNSVLQLAAPSKGRTAQDGPGEKALGSYTRLPGVPRKNVIPPRRPPGENGNQAQYAVRKNSLSLNNAPDEDPTQHLSGEAEADEGEAPAAGQRREIGDEPVQAIPPVTGPDVPANHRAEEVGLDIADKPTSVLLPVVDQRGQAAERVCAASEVAGQLATQETQAGFADGLAWDEKDGYERGQRSEELIRQSERTDTWKLPVTPAPQGPLPLASGPLTPLPSTASTSSSALQKSRLTRGRAFFLMLLLAIVVINATTTGFSSFFGPQGWGAVLNGSSNTGTNIIQKLRQQLHQQTPKATIQATPTPLTPAQVVSQILANMTLDQKLGQMMMVQFSGQSYTPDLSAMISQYQVGAVIYYQYNIASKSQLINLNEQIQQNADLPMIVAIDQEGGTVDRLVDLDGPQPPASQIGATGNPNVAYQQGIKDAQDLSSYGFNLNLAPVVDVTNVYNPQLYDRTYGNNPTIVTQMAGAYLQGLQKSGKVLGSLKHFPGLGDVSTDPHYGLPYLTRSLSSLDALDWAPYRNLINQGDVYSILVTHEIVKALDPSQPSSLSPKVIGYLRNQLHFQGVIITDSLTMDSISNYYTYGQAAAKAVEAGDDILMGAASPSDVAQMINGIKQAINSGAISMQQINAAVTRILLFKYEMGLLHI
jgi:beta-N-acetylhexosaminidase